MARFYLFVFVLVTPFLFQNCQPENEEKAKWFKGNTHVHTTLCGHADTEPEAVAGWYLDRGYNFLVLSEHNQFIDFY